MANKPMLRENRWALVGRSTRHRGKILITVVQMMRAPTTAAHKSATMWLSNIEYTVHTHVHKWIRWRVVAAIFACQPGVLRSAPRGALLEIPILSIDSEDVFLVLCVSTNWTLLFVVFSSQDPTRRPAGRRLVPFRIQQH